MLARSGTGVATQRRGGSFSTKGPADRPHMAAAARGGQRQRLAVAAAAAGSDTGLGAQIAKMAKKIQGALPIVGLVSRLASAQGGFDEMAYGDFTRTLIDKASPTYAEAVQQLGARHGKVANSRWILLVLWIARHGPGIVAPRDVVLAARRLRVSQDIQIEMERFELAREEALAKYRYMERPMPPLEEQLGTAVDALAALVLDLKDGQPLPDPEAGLIGDLVATVWPEASAEQVAGAVAGRQQRAYS